ncbi:hypothetical protein HAX54_029620 [Datura stramonium]|uniref:Uncharacterized protein n=1 Tax=Datura stramonium TaxID=4076 RepID=A0ABS8V8L0_DATST|nr:hypothetical protein [Datura stramonium]
MEPASPPSPLPAPSITKVRRNLDLLTSSFNKIGMKSDILLDLEDRLKLEASSEAKRGKIIKFMENLAFDEDELICWHSLPTPYPNSGQTISRWKSSKSN